MTVKEIVKTELNIKTQKSSNMINKCQKLDTNLKIRKCLANLKFVSKTNSNSAIWLLYFQCENGHEVIKKLFSINNKWIVKNIKN